MENTAEVEKFRSILEEFFGKMPATRERVSMPVPMYEITYLYANLRTLAAPTDDEKKLIDHLFPIIQQWALGIRHHAFTS